MSATYLDTRLLKMRIKNIMHYWTNCLPLIIKKEKRKLILMENKDVPNMNYLCNNLRENAPQSRFKISLPSLRITNKQQWPENMSTTLKKIKKEKEINTRVYLFALLCEVSAGQKCKKKSIFPIYMSHRLYAWYIRLVANGPITEIEIILMSAHFGQKNNNFRSPIDNSYIMCVLGWDIVRHTILGFVQHGHRHIYVGTSYTYKQATISFVPVWFTMTTSIARNASFYQSHYGSPIRP